MAVSRKAMTEGLSKCGNSDPLSLVLAGDARDSSPWSARGAFGCSRTSAFFDCSMPYVIRHPLGKASYRSLKYPARGETTKFIRPILWEMTFFASEP